MTNEVKRITATLNRIASGDTSSPNHLDGLFKKAFREGVLSESDFAKALGCDPRHAAKSANSLKTSNLVKTLRSLGFGNR